MADLFSEARVLTEGEKDAVIRASQCGCTDCRERSEKPKGYWTRTIKRIVEETSWMND